MPFSIRTRSRSNSNSSTPSTDSSGSASSPSSRTTLSSMRSAWSNAQSKLTVSASAPNNESFAARRDKARAMTFTDAMAPVTQGAVATGRAVKRGGTAAGSAIAQGSKATGKAVATGATATGSAIKTGSVATGEAIASASKATGKAAVKTSKKAAEGIAEGSKKTGKFLSKKASDAKADIKRRANTYGEKVMNMDTAELDAEFWATSAGVALIGAGPVIVVGAIGAGVLGAGVGVLAAAAPVVGGIFAGQVLAKNLSKDNLSATSKKVAHEAVIAAEGFASVTGMRKLGRSTKSSAQRTRDFMKFFGEELSEAFAEAKSKTNLERDLRALSSESSSN